MADDFTVLLEKNKVINPQATLILAVYNKPHYLELVLAGLETQVFKNFELIVCDDGSNKQIAEIIADFAAKVPFSVIHVWHEDKGFRKCRIINRGLLKAQGNIVVFLDADCIPYPQFMADHVAQSDNNCYLAGRRVDLAEKFTQKLTCADVQKGKLSLFNPKLLWSIIRGETQNGNRAMVIRNSWLRNLFHLYKIPDARGCNFSMPLAALKKINGFDDVYEGPGYGEDTDVELRLINAGYKIKSVKGMAVQYHLYHKQLPYADHNKWRLEQIIKTGRILPEQGCWY